MTSERIRRRIERLLDQAEEAADQGDWTASANRAREALALDPEYADAQTLLSAATRMRADVRQDDALAAPAAVVPAPQPTSFAGGRYEVRRFLGEGGKKKVYLAHDSLLDRDVAFALIKTEGLDQPARERITREAQAMGRLGDHPNIVTVFDIGEEPVAAGFIPHGAPTTQPYLVLPLLPGGDVEGLIEKAEDHKLPIDQAVRIVLETCQGLEFAHSKGIVHRDIKPGNVWLAEDGRVQVGDFGLAVAIDRSRLTQAGMMVGTVSYMPPEQAMGGEVGPRSDLYSLGAMLYEMVCGRPPFVGDESVAIIGQHLNTPPVAPTWHRPDCPPALEALIVRLLEKDPERRPASAAEVKQALESIGTPVGAQHAAPLRGASSETPASSATGDPLYRRTFVGREQELKQLQSAFDAAMSGQGGLVMVVGEPGIGKTAICEQLATYVTLRGGKTLVGHCYEEGSLSLPYLAFVEAMRSYVLARDPDGLRSDLGTGAADVARIVSEVRDRVQVELRPAGDPEDDRWRLLQAVSGFLRNAATVQPMLIVVEDLHWADRGTLDLLLHVARNLQGARLLVLGTYRDVEVDRMHPLSGTLAELRRVGTFARVPLRGLTVDEVHRMYQAIRGQEVAWAQAELVHRQTEGHPLFVQEVLRYLVEEGIVYREGGRYQVRPGDQASEAVIPEGLRDVVGRRLSRLSEQANQLLSVAAVVGREFRLDVLQKVLAVPEEQLFSALEDAQERAIIEQRQMLGGVGFRFSHAFFRQTLYEEVFAPRRIRLHQQVGRALEELYARRLEEHAAELAEHFTQSTEGDDLEKAVRYSELAAQRALSVYAYAEAVRHLEQAIRAQEVLDPDDYAKLCDLFIALGDALLPAGDPGRAMEYAATRALSLAESVSDEGRAWLACRIGLDGGMLHNPSAMSDPWLGWLDQAEQYAHISTAARVRFSRAKAVALLQSGHHLESWQLQEDALQLARATGDADVEFSIAWFLLRYVIPAHRDQQLRITDEFSKRPRAGVSVPNLGGLLLNAGTFYLSLGDRIKAEDQWRDVSELVERTRHPRFAAWALGCESILATLDGRLEEVMELARQILQQTEAAGSTSGRRDAANASRRAALWLGQVDQIELDSGASLAWRSLALAHLGRTGEAREAILRVMEEAEQVPNEQLSLTELVTYLEASILAPAETFAAEVAHVLIPMSAWVEPLSGTSVGRLLGAASALLGKPDEARGYYAQALEVCERVRFRPEIALIRLDLAELLLEHYPDERAGAIDHLDFAIGEFREMKMQPSLERALRHRGLLKA